MSQAQDSDTRRATMPLFNFQSDLDKIELGSNLWIREITRNQVESLQGRFTKIIDGFEMSLITHALETEILYEPRIVNETHELFRTVVLSLRLFKPGDIYEKVTFFKRKRGHGASVFGWWKLVPYACLSRPYRFADDEVDDFVKFLSRVRSLNINETPDLKIPLHRFNKSYDDPLEEKFIDLAIAFESFVRPNRGNLGDKVAIGVSMLIGKTPKERKTVRQDIVKAYKVRNEIVHGVVLRVDKDKEKLYYRAEDYLRRAILKTLD